MHYQFTILHNDQCNFWRLLKRDLEAFIRERKWDATIVEVLVKDDREAARLKFSGSPQLLVNGKDIDPMASRITNYHAGGCRPVMYTGTLYEYPPMAMVAEAIAEAR